MKPTALVTSVVLLLLLLACAGKTPTTTRYLLPASVPPGTHRVDPPVWIALGRIQVAPYLNQAGLVVETEARQVRPARYHKWAEPLADGLRRFLSTQVSAALGYDIAADASQRQSWSYTVDVSIDRLHGTLSGEALLAAHWQVRPAAGKGESVSFRFAESQPLPREGYAGLVEAEITLVTQLAQAIADSLRQVTGP